MFQKIFGQGGRVKENSASMEMESVAAAYTVNWTLEAFYVSIFALDQTKS